MINPKFTKYAEDVVSGRQVACLYIKQACQRYLDWFKRTDIEFREDKAQRVVSFVELLTHFKGSSAGKPFILEPWQEWIVYNIFGWYWKGTNKRVIRNVYLTVARKNGKTALAAALSLYLLLADGEASAEIFCLANSVNQAKIAFDLCDGFAKSIDRGKKKYFKRYRDALKIEETKSILRILSAEANKLDGLNTSAFILDEFHAAKSTELLDVMRSSQGNRENPLAIIISSAGFLIGGPMHQMEEVNKQILAGVVQDDTTFCAMYHLDDGDVYTDESVWEKCCPNIDVTCEREGLRQQCNQSKLNPSLEVGVKTKNFNMWCSTSETWIPDYKIMEAMMPVSMETMKTDYCYVGIDLASVRDMTAVSYLTIKDGKYYFKTDYYLPEDTITEGISSNTYNYKQWADKGFLKLTPGNACDYDMILQDILDFNKEIPCYKLMTDTWNASQFQISAIEKGLNILPFSQTLGSFNRPTKEFERLIYQGKIVIDANPITRWCFSNITLKIDPINENIKPIKKVKENKIDGSIAMIEALGGKLNEEGYDTTITS